MLKTISFRKLKVGFLGAANGVVYSVTMLLLIGWWRASAEKRNLIDNTISGDHINLVGNERWISIVIVWGIAFTLASLIVDYFWRHKKNSILFWEAVGVIAVTAWNVFVLLGTWLDQQAGDTISYSRVTSSGNPLFGPISLAVVIFVNFVYGYLVSSFPGKFKQTHDELRICLFSALNGSLVGLIFAVLQFGYAKYLINQELLLASTRNENTGYMLEPVMDGFVVLVCIVAFAATGHLVHRYFVSKPSRLLVFWLCISCSGLMLWYFETVIVNSSSFLLITAFAAISILTYRLWIVRPYSRPLLWVAIGVTAVWMVFVAVQSIGLLMVQPWELRDPRLWIIALGVVLVTNFFFGTTIKHFVTEDGWPMAVDQPKELSHLPQ